MKHKLKKDSTEQIKKLTNRISLLELEKKKSKQLEAELKNTQRILNSIINTLPDIIYRLDFDGRILFVNDVIKKYNYKPEELIGKHIFDLVHPEDLEKAKWRVNERRTGERRTKSFEVRLLTPDQKSIPFEIRSKGIYDGPVFLIEAEGLYDTDNPNEKTFLGTQAIARDVSEQKKMESQLKQAQKMEAIGLLAGGVAHDFNNLLTVMLGYTELLMNNKAELDQDYNKLKSIQKAAQNAASITQQLLAFSRRQVLHPKIININLIFQKIEEILRRLIRENVEIIYDFENELANIKTDPVQMEQIIFNLAQNASDSMPNGGILIFRTQNVYLNKEFVNNHLGTKKGHYVNLSVIDNGIGMSDEVIANIFEPFFTTKELGRGTGLGLATVYGIVKQSHGNIWVKSTPDMGTTFDIYFPRCDEESEMDDNIGHIKPDLRGNESIMVVEDQKDLRILISESLLQHGYKIIEAKDGEDALIKYEQYSGKVDLVLTDVIMPHIGGIDLVNRLRLKDNTIKVIYMSGYAHNEIAKMGILDIDKVYIQKPFSIKDLLLNIKKILLNK